MKFFTKHILATVLVFSMLLGLAACGSGSSSDTTTSGAEGSDTASGADSGDTAPGTDSGDTSVSGSDSSNDAAQPEDNSNSETQQAPELTLADGEAKLIYAKDNYVVTAFHGPYKDVGAWFCDKDEERLEDHVGYGHPSDGWTLIITREFPEDYDLNSGFGVTVSDYNAEKNSDGTYQTQNYFITEQMTEEELKSIGLDFLDGHCCVVGNGTTMYGGDTFGLTYGITWLDDYYFMSFEEIDGFADRFSYFAGDGTPLAEYFEGYSTLEITTMPSMFDVMLKCDDGTNDKELHKSKCEELKACKPYMVYTGLDGTTQQFRFFDEE